jgi:aspartyl aminopeptidase
MVFMNYYQTLLDDDIQHDSYSRAISNSYIISADQAHGAHPNFPEKHEVSKISMKIIQPNF